MINKPPVASVYIPEEWTALVREILRRDGQAIRAHATLPMIEIKSLRTNEWGRIMLFGSGFMFTDTAERDAVMRRIQNG